VRRRVISRQNLSLDKDFPFLLTPLTTAPSAAVMVVAAVRFAVGGLCRRSARHSDRIAHCNRRSSSHSSSRSGCIARATVSAAIPTATVTFAAAAAAFAGPFAESQFIVPIVGEGTGFGVGSVRIVAGRLPEFALLMEYTAL
jgi:hypothetical protein